MCAYVWKTEATGESELNNCCGPKKQNEIHKKAWEEHGKNSKQGSCYAIILLKNRQPLSLYRSRDEKALSTMIGLVQLSCHFWYPARPQLSII